MSGVASSRRCQQNRHFCGAFGLPAAATGSYFSLSPGPIRLTALTGSASPPLEGSTSRLNSVSGLPTGQDCAVEANEGTAPKNSARKEQTIPRIAKKPFVRSYFVACAISRERGAPALRDSHGPQAGASTPTAKQNLRSNYFDSIFYSEVVPHPAPTVRKKYAATDALQEDRSLGSLQEPAAAVFFACAAIFSSPPSHRRKPPRNALALSPRSVPLGSVFSFLTLPPPSTT